MLAKEAKAQIVGDYQRSVGDTGSVEVQVALWTARITSLTEHLKKFKKDKHSRRGLLNIVSKRKRLLEYYKRSNFNEYKALIERLGLRH